MPRINFTPFLPYETSKPVDSTKFCNEQHVRITRSMLFSDAYSSLNGNAMHLYQVLKIKFHKQAKSNKDFEISKSYGVKVLGLSSNSEKSVRRALKELVEKGFLAQTLHSKGGGINAINKINRYKFSSNWKNYKK